MINFNSSWRQSTGARKEKPKKEKKKKKRQGQLICRFSCESIRDAAVSNLWAGSILFILLSIKIHSRYVYM